MRNAIFCCVVAAFLVLFNCTPPISVPVDEYGNVSITAGDNGLVTDLNAAIVLEEESVAGAPVTSFNYNITQISRIEPPEVRGHAVQANDIIISDNMAYLAYNTAGPVFDGAVLIVKITGKTLRIEKEFDFASMDIISLNLQGSKLYFGGMADPDVFDGQRSFVGVIDLSGPKASAIAGSVVYLNSYAATGIAAQGGKFYVSVGAADGGVEILDDTLTPEYDSPAIDADDIRDIKEYGGGVIALAGTTDSVETDGRILIIKGEAVDKEIAIPDFDSPEAKATIEVNGDYAYLGLSAKGFQVCDLATEDVIFTYPNPDAEENHVTNSITFQDDLIFSANGEYGFRVLRYTPGAASASIVGYYGFNGLTDRYGQNYSANHIKYRNKYLFVAAGSGGVCAYQLALK